MRRERVETPTAISGISTGSTRRRAPDAPLVVLFHGLEGGSQSHYARALLRRTSPRAGWRGVVPHFRGCSGEPNRLPRAYHSGDHAEVGAMLAAVRARDRAGDASCSPSASRSAATRC